MAFIWDPGGKGTAGHGTGRCGTAHVVPMRKSRPTKDRCPLQMEKGPFRALPDETGGLWGGWVQSASRTRVVGNCPKHARLASESAHGVRKWVKRVGRGVGRSQNASRIEFSGNCPIHAHLSLKVVCGVRKCTKLNIHAFS